MLKIKLILCPVDFSEFSRRAYHHAQSLADHYRAKLVAPHIVELSRYPFADYVASTGDYGELCRSLGEGDFSENSERALDYAISAAEA
jgi:nucleotide-binding universal stress UspA family protein